MDLIGGSLQRFGFLFENNAKNVIFLIKKIIRVNGFVLVTIVLIAPRMGIFYY